MNRLLAANAPWSANLTLLLEMAMGFALAFGAWLARRGRYRQHAWCQSTMVLLNLAVIGIAMLPSFYSRVMPKIPARIGRSFYFVATAHAVAAAGAEVAALYLLLAAGTTVLPDQLRPINLKTAMRFVFAFWWTALLLGVGTYIRWYSQR